MSILKLSMLLSVICLVSSCADLVSFEDRRREPGTNQIYVGQSKPEAPVFCYNPLLTNTEELLNKANDLCKANATQSHAVFVDNKSFSCRLFVPSRAYFNCVK